MTWWFIPRVQTDYSHHPGCFHARLVGLIQLEMNKPIYYQVLQSDRDWICRATEEFSTWEMVHAEWIGLGILHGDVHQ